jgi:hypothetical protein
MFSAESSAVNKSGCLSDNLLVRSAIEVAGFVIRASASIQITYEYFFNYAKIMGILIHEAARSQNGGISVKWK